jgi:uncharacterized protein YkwD
MAMGMARGVFALVLAGTMLLPAAAVAQSPPSILKLEFDATPVVGKPSVLTIRVADPRKSLSGLTVHFGEGEDGFGESACQTGARGTLPAGPLPPADSYEFRVEHVYVAAQPRQVTVKVFNGTCTDPGASATQTFLVTPFGATTAPAAPVVGLPALAGIGGSRNATASRRARTAQAGGCGPDAVLVPSSANLARIRAATECLVSAERVSRGLSSLKPATGLRRAGLIQVEDMLTHRYFAHVRDGGPDLFARLRTAGYDFVIAGENLGAGTGQYSTPAEMVQQWLASPPHRENMLERTFGEVGLGIRTGFPLNGGSSSGATYALELGEPVRLTYAQRVARYKRILLRKKCKKASYRRAHAKACRAVRR